MVIVSLHLTTSFGHNDGAGLEVGSPRGGGKVKRWDVCLVDVMRVQGDRHWVDEEEHCVADGRRQVMNIAGG
jgi:hypothetical protein